MKVLLVLMILLSIVIAIPVNGGEKGWFSLYGAEFIDPVYLIKTGAISLTMIIGWVMLLMAHVTIICLPFLTKNLYFKELLIFSPLLFIILFAVWNLIIAFLLVPFIIVWLVCLLVYFNTKAN